MPIELDRYYTPENVAVSIIERANIKLAPSVFADSTCGSGRLLDAASTVFHNTQCIGIDRDSTAISQLRLRRPTWHLAVANLLGCKKHIMRFSNALPRPVDYLVLNPPFSLGDRKSTNIHYENSSIKGSIAMAYLLRSLEIFKPLQGTIAIVPESLLHSSTDKEARDLLFNKYTHEKLLDLRNSTFRGARVNASAIHLHHGPHLEESANHKPNFNPISTKIVRGSLPVYLMKETEEGNPFLHSTGIRKLITGDKISTLKTTSSSSKGKTQGWCILIPRVGLPDKSLIKPINLQHTTQLSDCVIALTTNNESIAKSIEERILIEWDSFFALYKGTGARYITISRLSDWLNARNIATLNS